MKTHPHCQYRTRIGVQARQAEYNTDPKMDLHVETLCWLQVIVQGLPFAYAWQDLKDLFKPIGGVVQADIVMGQDGRSRGWGTVNFETQADAEKAIKVICTAVQ